MTIYLEAMKSLTCFFRLFYLVVIMCFMVACSDKEDSSESSMYGVVNGMVSCTQGGHGFKVILSDPNDIQPMQVAVTESNGAFCFSEVVAGKYIIDVQRDGFALGVMTVNGEIVSYNHMVNVYKDQITNVLVQMVPTSGYIDDEITVTDMADNPIGSVITIPKYTTSIAIKLYNGTSQNVSWSLRHRCFISGYKDTVVGNYEGHTYHTFDVFDDVSPSSGSLAPGNVTVITGIINPQIYTLDRFSDYAWDSYTKMTLFSSYNLTQHNRDIELLFPWGK